MFQPLQVCRVTAALPLFQGSLLTALAVPAVFLLVLTDCVRAGDDPPLDAPRNSRPITDVRAGDFKVYKASVGDTWDPTWADDDNLYAASNDTSGWDEACSSNIAFNRMSGDDFLNLTGKTVNGMLETGGWGTGEGPDGRTWKSSGCVSVNGMLYLVIGRHMYGDKSKDHFRRQTAIDSSIIISTDHGLTWTRSIAECYQHPMFPGNRFPTPYFIHYGKDGTAPPVDQADQLGHRGAMDDT
jgi:hypothetical protein